MIDEAGFLDAIRHSGVSKVAIIDDVFDPPKVNESNSGKIQDYLEAPAAAQALTDVRIDAAKQKKLKTAVEESDFESEHLTAAIEALYFRYIETLDNRFDPGGLFALVKGDNLRRLRPLLLLLKKCATIQIQYAGSEQLDSFKETHLLFVDFYLDEDLGPDQMPTAQEKKEAVSASLTRVNELIEAQNGKMPSVILMSSWDVEKQAADFRAKIGKGNVFASRFAFLNKGHVTSKADGTIEINPDAADALLDVVQSYEFGRALQAGLDSWLSSAASAVESLRGEIGNLDLKDFAYLVRFRLAQEGQGLLEYLEWFFGECLLDELGKAVDKSAQEDPQVAALNGSAAARIEGAFDGPTKKVADLYHRVRIENPRSNRKSNFRLGDIYRTDAKKQTIVATITPDCDLIVRPKTKKRSAPTLLTVGGKLKPFDAPDVSVSDFFMVKGKPHNISWDRRAVSSHDFAGWPAPGTSSDAIEYLGTLRPLYAQELQRNVLHDLGRVGVSVAPAIGMTAGVTATVRKKGGKTEQIDLPGVGAAPCVVVMGRGGADKAKVVFPRRFIGVLLRQLRSIDASTLDKPGTLTPLEHPNAAKNFEKMYRQGVALEEAIDFGIFLTANPSYRAAGDGPWCWLTISMAGNHDEAE